MASAKALLGKVFGSLVFRTGKVTRLTQLSPRYLSVRVEGEGLRGASYEPGDKVQAYIEDVGMRTYSPIDWDAAKGAFELVVFLHGASTPGVTWARGLGEGTTVSVLGPRRSLRATRAAPIVLFGDETSVGVVRALGLTSPGSLRVVLEATDAPETSSVLHDAGIRAEVVARAAGDAHVAAVVSALTRELQASPGAELLLTGAAPSIQAVQRALKAQQIRPSATRAYWSPGKVGLD
jgi:NADPH-dependent ferric siderophore reductase